MEGWNHATKENNYILPGRARADVGRPNDEGYPVRGIVKDGLIYTGNLKTLMETVLKRQNDPRMFGNGDVFDRYPTASDAKDYYNRYMKGDTNGKMKRNKSDSDKLKP